MPGEVNCIFTKVLIPFVEKEVGAAGVAAILQAAGHSREYLIADHNWLPLSVADGLARLTMELMGEPDEARWGRRLGEYLMDWKPSHEQRSYMGTYTLALGSPRAIYQRAESLQQHITRVFRLRVVEMHRARAHFRLEMEPGLSMPKWLCEWTKVGMERYPTNWRLPRAVVAETQCAACGAQACEWDVRWKNPSIGARFWTASALGAAAGTATFALHPHVDPWAIDLALGALPAVAGLGIGLAWREWHRRREIARLRDLQSEEILHANDQLETKFRDLETRIEQLSLLMDLSAAVNATLDVEKIYEQALDRLVQRMGFQAANLYLVDEERRRLHLHRRAVRQGNASPLDRVEFPLDTDVSVSGRVARTGLPAIVDDVEATSEPVHLATARALGVRSLVAVPLRVKERIFGVLNVVASERARFAPADVEMLSAVANHVALAVDRAESFQTIGDLTRGLEDKVRVRTEQLRTANEELQTAYRDLQRTQMQLIQREKMASVGQLVAGVAHELNNPIGFVFSNVGTLEDFVKRLRAMLDVYRGAALPEAETARVEEQWRALKVDYALKYLDSMIQGIREGAERSRKIVRDLRVFARGQDEVWQTVDLHEEIESSLTLLNHLLKDRVTVERRFGALPAVECIRSQIDQVFLNLLANAGQAIRGEGTIIIETRAEDGAAVVAIADTGPGIPADVLGKVFDPFFTTKPVGEGTGLGLSISYEIVKKHGGELRAESPAGGGARFTLRLPLARAAR
ncbi:MAG TPA: ATP-binding protein [Candidatus Methylomirabilis sp.]|nr:ATP-binding protein [Candidatus Methylomirabilis sp.]